MAEKLITMSIRELSRYDVIKQLLDGIINGTDASKQIGVSIRQVKRLKLRVNVQGAKGLIHGNRGKTSNRKLDPKIIAKAEKYLQEKYSGFGPTLAAEKLAEIQQIKISKESVRQLMTNLGLWKQRPRKSIKKYHAWRARKENPGELEQFDGSYHKWFGEEESCLLLSVDDATGKITHAEFGYNEGIVPVFNFWLKYFTKNGLPLSVYLDKFSTYKINHKNAVDNEDWMTQFQRAMSQVGIKPITAHSPQAKGRVERMFETLQDRLVKELRLAGITDIDEANKFLEKYIPKFNAKFAVGPKRTNDLHKQPIKEIQNKLPQIFSIQNTRVVMNDYTVRFANGYYQLDETQPTTVYKKDKVIIEEHLNGEVKINLKNHYLNFKVLPERPKKEIDIKLPALTVRKISDWKPPIDHPWRTQFILSKRIHQPEKILIAA
jgi:transposase